MFNNVFFDQLLKHQPVCAFCGVKTGVLLAKNISLIDDSVVYVCELGACLDKFIDRGINFSEKLDAAFDVLNKFRLKFFRKEFSNRISIREKKMIILSVAIAACTHKNFLKCDSIIKVIESLFLEDPSFDLKDFFQKRLRARNIKLWLLLRDTF